MRSTLALALLALIACSTVHSTRASDAADAEAGRLYASRQCSTCHNVLSRAPDAPPWRIGPSFAAVAREKTATAMGLNVFLQTTHASMPNLIIPEQDRRNLIAYILSLKTSERGPST